MTKCIFNNGGLCDFFDVCSYQFIDDDYVIFCDEPLEETKEKENV